MGKGKRRERGGMVVMALDPALKRSEGYWSIFLGFFFSFSSWREAGFIGVWGQHTPHLTLQHVKGVRKGILHGWEGYNGKSSL